MPLAVITGASRGLGAALAHALEHRGWNLLVDGRDANALAAATLGTAAHALAGDVPAPRHPQAVADAARALGGVDLLVNNASTLGASPLPAVRDLTEDTLLHMLDTNLVAPHALTRLLLTQLRKHHGTVLNISSDAAVAAYPGWSGYGWGKAALDPPSRVLALEEPDLRVYAVDPG